MGTVQEKDYTPFRKESVKQKADIQQMKGAPVLAADCVQWV